MSDETTAPGPGDNEAEAEPEFELTEASGVGGPAVEAPPETPATPSRTTIPPEKAVEMLSKISLFSALQPSYLRRIANLGIEEDYPLSALIFKEGAPGDKLYLILSGECASAARCRAWARRRWRCSRRDALRRDGADRRRTAQRRRARPRARAGCWWCRKEAFEDLLFVHKDLAYELLWSVVRMLSSRLRETNDKMTFMAVTSKF